jgi:acyl dehydratase
VTAGIGEGDELAPLALRPDLEQVIKFCGLTWAFPRFFYDIDAARAQGMPGTLVPGPLKLGLLCRAVEDWLDGRGWVCHVRAAHRRPDITGRPITITGRVVRTFEHQGRERADLELAVVNEDGAVSVRGFATVELQAAAS